MFSGTNNQKNSALEEYLGSRDVQQGNGTEQVEDIYRTGKAKGSIITYSLDEDNVLTIERIMQQNNIDPSSGNLEIDNAGKAAKLLDRLSARRAEGLTTPKQIRFLEGRGFQHVGTWQFETAKNLIDRIAADPAFGLTKEEILAHMDPKAYIGRCEAQVEEFSAQVVDPIRAQWASLLTDEQPELKV